MKEKEFYVDFSGNVTVKASSKEEAERKFWQIINNMNLSRCVWAIWAKDNKEELDFD